MLVKTGDQQFEGAEGEESKIAASISIDRKSKLELCLGLADLTLDVNHILGALIYLLQDIDKDFSHLVYENPPEAELQVPQEAPQPLPVDERLPDDDLQKAVLRAAMNPQLKRGKRSKSVDYKQLLDQKFKPLVFAEEISFSDTKSMKTPTIPEKIDTGNARKEPPVLKASLAEMTEEALKEKL